MKYLFILTLLFAGHVASAEELRIGIKEAKPFAYQEAGEWKGISVDLIAQLSKDVKFTYTFIPYENMSDMLDSTASGEVVDLSISAISVTRPREELVDFTHKYFTTSIGILSEDKSSGWSTAIWIIKRILIVLSVFLVALYMVGFIIQRIEGADNIVGVNNGAWRALVTFSTTGYGDEVPKTMTGKLVASAWIIASLFLISIFTGYISSALTIKLMTESPSTLADLYKADVVAVNGSIAQAKLHAVGIKHTGVDTFNEAVERFTTGKADALVHDDAMLSFASKSMDDVTIWPVADSMTDYAITLPPKSDLTERFNLGILQILTSPKWKDIQSKYNVL